MSPDRDLDSIKKEMTECIKHVASRFKENGVALEAAPVASLAATIFNDYRHNNPRDIAEAEVEAATKLRAAMKEWQTELKDLLEE